MRRIALRLIWWIDDRLHCRVSAICNLRDKLEEVD